MEVTYKKRSLCLLLSCPCPCEGGGKRHGAKDATEGLHFSLGRDMLKL